MVAAKPAQLPGPQADQHCPQALASPPPLIFAGQLYLDRSPRTRPWYPRLPQCFLFVRCSKWSQGLCPKGQWPHSLQPHEGPQHLPDKEMNDGGPGNQSVPCPVLIDQTLCVLASGPWESPLWQTHGLLAAPQHLPPRSLQAKHPGVLGRIEGNWTARMLGYTRLDPPSARVGHMGEAEARQKPRAGERARAGPAHPRESPGSRILEGAKEHCKGSQEAGPATVSLGSDLLPSPQDAPNGSELQQGSRGASLPNLQTRTCWGCAAGRRRH